MQTRRAPPTESEKTTKVNGLASQSSKDDDDDVRAQFESPVWPLRAPTLSRLGAALGAQRSPASGRTAAEVDYFSADFPQVMTTSPIESRRAH